MSTLTGHAKITAAAVRELALEWNSNPLATGMTWAGLPGAAVMRDIFDVLSLGHWADFGQKHHFMRQFDSQSPFEAYEAAVEWIRSNALQSARTMAARVARLYPQGLGSGRSPQSTGLRVFHDVNWQPLGNAVHACEDSFAKGHTERGKPLGGGTPGSIIHIKRYAGTEKHLHAEGDEEWKGSQRGFSDDGWFAIEAVKALLKVVITTAQSNTNPVALVGWQAFRDKWIRADASLSKSRDRVFELIDRYYTGVRVGATNVKTLNMNEDGLAKALLAEDPQTTLAVFVRLDEQYNSDADDVAELYVNLVKSQGGPKLATLQANKELIRRLIKVMDEGWTSSGEKKCITFLKTLL